MRTASGRGRDRRSELCLEAWTSAVRDLGLPEGVFSLLVDSGRDVGQGRVADHRIAGFIRGIRVRDADPLII